MTRLPAPVKKILIEGFVVLGLIIWLLTLNTLCGRRDIDIHDKVSWIVAVLVFNVAGAIVYWIFGPNRDTKPMPGDPPIDTDLQAEGIPGYSWNPIQGENPMANGVGLNPKGEHPQEDPEDDSSEKNSTP